VIDHLSHELKTPLAIISGVLHRLAVKLPEKDNPEIAKTVARGLRNVARLTAVQEKVDDILNLKIIEDEEQYLKLVENIIDMNEELSEEDAGLHQQWLYRIKAKIENLFEVAPVAIEAIRLDRFLDSIYGQALNAASSRSVKISISHASGLFVDMDQTVLSKVFAGILKNAIENTPDGGLIEIETTAEGDNIRVVFRDTGVGITQENQKSIFEGFFHTQNTEMYSSGKPYQFNAGGTGSDLLRIKTFAKRFGFSVDVTSRRCDFLQGDADQCPGRISDCRHIQSGSECSATGGSTFTLVFPKSELSSIL